MILKGKDVLLAAERVSYAYGEARVVDDVSISVGRGEFLALVGPNGSGKSTLIKLLVGVLRPAVGAIRLFGAEPARFTERWRVGYVPQRPAVSNDVPATVEEIVATGRLARRRWGRLSSADHEAIDHALGVVGLHELRARRVGALSGGQQQRAFIARALASDPELLILDEPVAGVDAEAQASFRDALVHHVRVHNGSVLLVSHELGAVANDLDRVVVIKNSIRFDGPPSELVESGVSLGVHREDLPAWLEEMS